MIRTMTLLFTLGLSLIFVCSEVLGQTNISHYQLDAERFKFSKLGEKPFLVLPDGKKIEIPREWLYPPVEVETDRHSYVSSFNYQVPITSFQIGGDLLGLHLSSWDEMPPATGSAMAASGRDLFLIYDTKTQQISPGILDHGITKDRHRSMGCFFSTFHNFIIGDINNDGLTDIGVTREKIWCEEESDEENQIDFMSGPYYKKYPIEWYILNGDKWEKDSQYNGIRSEKATMKLPLIGLITCPIDFVREIYKGKLKEVK